MTTKVTVDAHAGWPVKVTTISLDSSGAPTNETEEGIVEPKTVRNFYVHSGAELRIQEMAAKSGL